MKAWKYTAGDTCTGNTITYSLIPRSWVVESVYSITEVAADVVKWVLRRETPFGYPQRERERERERERGTQARFTKQLGAHSCIDGAKDACLPRVLYRIWSQTIGTSRPERLRAMPTQRASIKDPKRQKTLSSNGATIQKKISRALTFAITKWGRERKKNMREKSAQGACEKKKEEWMKSGGRKRSKNERDEKKNKRHRTILVALIKPAKCHTATHVPPRDARKYARGSRDVHSRTRAAGESIIPSRWLFFFSFSFG